MRRLRRLRSYYLAGTVASGFRRAGPRGDHRGGDSRADTPDPIPNSEVKRPGGENTSLGR